MSDYQPPVPVTVEDLRAQPTYQEDKLTEKKVNKKSVLQIKANGAENPARPYLIHEKQIIKKYEPDPDNPGNVIEVQPPEEVYHLSRVMADGSLDQGGSYEINALANLSEWKDAKTKVPLDAIDYLNIQKQGGMIYRFDADIETEVMSIMGVTVENVPVDGEFDQVEPSTIITLSGLDEGGDPIRKTPETLMSYYYYALLIDGRWQVFECSKIVDL